MDEALLYRDLARLRTTDDGVPIPQADVDELRLAGGRVGSAGPPSATSGGSARLANRPHRWAGEDPADSGEDPADSGEDAPDPAA